MKGWRQKSWRGWEGRLQCTGTHGWFTLWKADGENDGKEEKQGWHIDGVRKGASSNYDDPLKRKGGYHNHDYYHDYYFSICLQIKSDFLKEKKILISNCYNMAESPTACIFNIFLCYKLLPDSFWLFVHIFFTCPQFLLPVHIFCYLSTVGTIATATSPIASLTWAFWYRHHECDVHIWGNCLYWQT